MKVLLQYLALATSFAWCSCDAVKLESQSIYYGLILSAAKNASTSDCLQKLTLIEKGIRDRTIWALKLLDASGSPETGFYWGNTYWMGSKKQCNLAASLRQANVSPYIKPYTVETPETVAAFPVSYYAAYFYHTSSFQIFTHWDNETKITLGLCLPSTCKEDDINRLLQEYFDSRVLSYQLLYNASFKMDGVMVTGPDTSWIGSPISIIFLISTLMIAVFIVLGTCYDLRYYQPILEMTKTNHITALEVETKNAMIINKADEDATLQNKIELRNKKENYTTKPELNTFKQILLSFSWYTNFNKIFTTTLRPSVLKPINGMRFFMTAFIIISHNYLFSSDYCNNRAHTYFLNTSYLGQIFANSSYSVDVFFLMGGFLMVHGQWRTKDLVSAKNHTWGNLSKLFLKAVFKRFRRLTPVYMFILGLTYMLAVTNHPVTPMWTNERNDLQCPKYWWTNILYINNIFPGTYSSMCMSWSYYLSNDMQFYVWTSFLFFLSKKHYKTAVSLLVGTFVASLVSLGTVAYLDNYKPFPDLFYIKAPLFYYPPWMRIGPYIVGVCYGYLYNMLDGKLQLNKITVRLLWIASTSTILCLFLAFSDSDFPTYLSILHTMLSRNLIALSVGWILLACLTGHGGPANTLLSAKGLMPLAHLTFTAYLLNPILIYLLVTSNDRPWQLDVSTVTLSGLGMIMLTFTCSVLIVISVEFPMDKVLNILFDNETTKKSIEENDAKNNK